MIASGTTWRLGSLFGTPIFVQPGYLMLIGLFGYMEASRQPHAMLQVAFLTAFAVTASLLIHEFGHVLAATLNGHRSQVVLVTMGGVTIPSGESRGWRAIMMSLSGPFAGLATCAVLYFLCEPSPEAPHLWIFLWNILVWINLVWSLFNLMPVYPMDGGHAFQDFLKLFRRAHEAEKVSAIVSIIVGLALAILCYQFGLLFGAIVLGFLVYQNWERLNAKR